MRHKLVLVIGMSILLAYSGAHGAPIHYEGTIANSQPVNGSVGGFGWTDDDAPNVDFWSFSATAGTFLSIVGSRLDSPLDLALSLFLGTTIADESLFAHNANFGGLSFLVSADDQIEVPGPFGDPALVRFPAPSTGLYTIAIGGNFSDAPGPFRYSLTVQQQQPIPDPATLPLLVSALFGWTCSLRLRRRGS